MAKIRKHFYFSGRVQGVGFRFQACRIAQGLGLTGYVQNLWDGRVELEAQGGGASDLGFDNDASQTALHSD